MSSQRSLFFQGTWNIEDIANCNDLQKLITLSIFKLHQTVQPLLAQLGGKTQGYKSTGIFYASNSDSIPIQKKLDMAQDFLSTTEKLKHTIHQYNNLISALNGIKETEALSPEQIKIIDFYKKSLPQVSYTRIILDRIIELASYGSDGANDPLLLIETLILMIKKLTRPAFQKLEENFDDYQRLVSLHGPGLSPFMAPERVYVLETAGTRLEQATQKYRNTISALEKIKTVKAITPEQKNILEAYQKEFRGRIQLIFGQVLAAFPLRDQLINVPK
jgi:hypothetical protein